MSTLLYSVLVVALVILVKQFTRNSGGSRKRGPYPPGPKPKPLVGNMFDFPTVDLGKEFLEWEKKYNSALLYASTLGNNLLIVNNKEDADELFDRRASLYSDRPTIPIVKVMGWEDNIVLLPYGDAWRYHRKICQKNFRRDAVENYQPLIKSKVCKLLDGLLNSPEDWEKHIKMFAVSIPMSTMYGYNVDSVDDPVISMADESNSIVEVLLAPRASVINLLPALGRLPSWTPGFWSRSRADRVWRLTQDMKRIPLEFVKGRVSEGTHLPSLLSNVLEKKDKLGAAIQKEEEAIINIALSVYSAAVETSISATGTFFYLMATHPEIQKKAQEELDRMVGSSRLPTFEDRESLPYIEAIYREVLRWGPPSRIGAPHALSDDDCYKGYFIPKGTTVLGNIWAMTHNPDVYPDPYTFKPERFFDGNGNLNDDNRILAYGFGRRVCVGKYIASASLWLTIASVLASFDIRKPKDAFGHDMEISDEYSTGLVSHKKSFKCSITPRRGFTTISKYIAEGVELVD